MNENVIICFERRETPKKKEWGYLPPATAIYPQIVKKLTQDERRYMVELLEEAKQFFRNEAENEK